MLRLNISVIILLIIAASMTGCESSKKATSEKRGLMLLETTQLGRNKGYYSKHGAKKLERGHKKIKKHRKFQ